MWITKNINNPQIKLISFPWLHYLNIRTYSVISFTTDYHKVAIKQQYGKFKKRKKIIVVLIAHLVTGQLFENVICERPIYFICFKSDPLCFFFVKGDVIEVFLSTSI